MEARLKLKHLAPYLPYGLCWYIDGASPTIRKMHIHNYYDLLASNRKPILRPLSDLTDPTEDRMKPIRKIAEFHGDIPLCHHYPSDYETWCVYEYEYLIKNHFDVFGLIDKGLAIDVNTLE